MSRQKKISIALAGVSLVALSISLSPAYADGKIFGPGGGQVGNLLVSSVPPAKRDYIELQAYEVEGDVIVDANVGGGTTAQNDVGLGITDGSLVTGDVINNVTVTANVTTAGVGDVGTSLVGIFVDDGAQIEGTIFNNGTVGALAKATSDEDAEALAFGLVSLSDWDPALENAAGASISATATANAQDTAVAIAGGVGQVAIQMGEGSGSISNEGSISATATANSINGDTDNSDEDAAVALAFGAGQIIASPDSATATLTNATGGDISVLAAADAYDTANTANALAAGAGALQAVASGFEASGTLNNQGMLDVDVTGRAESTDEDANGVAIGLAAAQIVLAKDDATAALTNDGEVDLNVRADAIAEDNALAVAAGLGSIQAVVAGGDITATMTNVGTLNATVGAYATGDDADAVAIDVANIQAAISLDEVAEASIVNDGSITANVTANATATDDALAVAAGLGNLQLSVGADGAIASMTNNGDVNVAVVATASAATDFSVSFGAGLGAVQAALALDGTAEAILDNTGTINVDVTSTGTGRIVYANSIGAGAVQVAGSFFDDAESTITNSSPESIDVTGNVIATADTYARADAYVIGAGQISISGLEDAYATVNNSGVISASGNAKATGGLAAFAEADAAAVDQLVISGQEQGFNYLSNSSAIDANATATASANSALAEARAQGVNQYAFAREVYHEVSNTGDITADSYASAIGEMAKADGAAFGVVQTASPYETYATLYNSGNITASAEVESDGVAGAASVGHLIYQPFERRAMPTMDLPAEVSTPDISLLSEAAASSPLGELPLDPLGRAAVPSLPDSIPVELEAPTLTLDVLNDQSGTITAYSRAAGGDVANAFAAGAWYEAGLSGFAIDGTIVNAGLISASAIASGATGTAAAFGVTQISNGPNNTVTTNTGTIIAYAEGPDASATGIAIGSYLRDMGSPPNEYLVSVQQVLPRPEDLAVINNDGGAIWAGFSTDGGTTIQRGDAITTRGGFSSFFGADVGEAPNPVEINLTGGVAGSDGKDFVISNDLVSGTVQSALREADSWGYVYGDIEITKDDVVNVTNGITIFDGEVNSDGALIGELNIFDGGKLVMVQNTVDGAAAANVAEFNIDSTGSLVYELTPDNGPDDYPQITAAAANIEGGRFVALYDAGFYANTTFYDNVVDAGVLTGTFGAVEDNSVLLVTNAVYDGEDNIDLNVQRVAFNEVEGLTRNQRAAGGAIENVYDRINPDTDFGRLVGSMFTLDDGDYNRFMDQLTGAEHAQHLQSVLWSTRAINRIISERMECEGAYGAYTQTSSAKVGDNTVMPTADAPVASTGCFEPGTASVWMRGFGQWNSLDGDQEAPGYDETQYGILFGGDYAFDENWFLGVAGGYFNSEGDFDDWGGREGATIDYDGLQLAAYGGYDNSIYYLRGVISYGNYEGESQRMIQFPGSSPIDPSGDPSSDTWSFYGETGYRFGITDSANLTPFAGLNLATASLDGFTEDDPQRTGAALEVHDSDADSVASVLGVRFDADLAMGSGVFTPVVSVAWMHEFGDTVQEVDMSFAGAPSGADFTVESSEVARDSVLVDAGAKFALDANFDFGLFYNGQFNEDYSSNAVTARIGYKF